MLIALNLIIAAAIVAGIVGVIVHASRASYAVDIDTPKRVVQPHRVHTGRPGSSQKAVRGYRTVSPSRG